MATRRSRCTWATRAGTSAWSCARSPHHSALETEYFFDARSRACAGRAPPMRSCCGGPTAASTAPDLLFALADERARWAELGRSSSLPPIGTAPPGQGRLSRPRRAAGVFDEVRAGKWVGLLDLKMERAPGRRAKRMLRLVVRVDRAHDRQEGPAPAGADIELEGWWTSLTTVAMADVSRLYKHHGTHEQFHSESRPTWTWKAAALGQVRHQRWSAASGGLRLQLPAPRPASGADRRDSPIRHPAKRRRIKTVLQEVMYRAAKVRRTRPPPGVDFLDAASPRMWKVFTTVQARRARGGFAVMQIRRRISNRGHFAAAKGRRPRGRWKNDVAHLPGSPGLLGRERTALGATLS